GLWVGEREILCQFLAPAFDGRQKVLVELGGAFFRFGGLSKFIERAFENCFARKDGGDFVPLVCVLQEGAIKDPRGGSGVVSGGLAAAIINGELLEVADDA